MSKTNVKPVAAAIGAAVVGTLLITASAGANPFSVKQVNNGPIQLASADGKCGTFTCGASKPKEASCSAKKGMAEGKCGASKAKEASCGANKGMAEGKCGASKAKEASCGANKGMAEGKCGASKAKHGMAEGKCGASR